MNRNNVIFSAVKFLELDSLPKIIPKNYKYHSDNCNKGLLPSTFGIISILVDSVNNYIIELNKPININGKQTKKFDARKHKVICKICNQFIRF